MERETANRPTSATSARMAAMVVGIAFFVSIFFVVLVDDVLLANFVVPGDTSALAQDIAANPPVLLYASIFYLVVLVLDAVVGLGLYVVLKPANKRLAALVGALRMQYASVLIVGILALLFQMVDVTGFAAIKLTGYVFFAGHIFLLGCLVFVSGFIPKYLGVLLVFASFNYAVFFVDIGLPENLLVLPMLTMAIAEIALCVWLLVKRNSLPETSLPFA